MQPPHNTPPLDSSSHSYILRKFVGETCPQKCILGLGVAGNQIL